MCSRRRGDGVSAEKTRVGRDKALEIRRQTAAEIDWDEVIARLKVMLAEVYRVRRVASRRGGPS
jgi:hypothetical protein